MYRYVSTLILAYSSHVYTCFTIMLTFVCIFVLYVCTHTGSHDNDLLMIEGGFKHFSEKDLIVRHTSGSTSIHPGAPNGIKQVPLAYVGPQGRYHLSLALSLSLSLSLSHSLSLSLSIYIYTYIYTYVYIYLGPWSYLVARYSEAPWTLWIKQLWGRGAILAASTFLT